MVQLPRKAWEAGGLQERSEESKDRTEMKVKDLIKALQERDPELEVMFEEDDSGWGGSREVKGAWDCQGHLYDKPSKDKPKMVVEIHV